MEFAKTKRTQKKTWVKPLASASNDNGKRFLGIGANVISKLPKGDGHPLAEHSRCGR